MDIFLHKARYQGDTDSDYKNNTFYNIWIVQRADIILIKKEEDGKVFPASSKRLYNDINEFFNTWGMVNRYALNTKL